MTARQRLWLILMVLGGALPLLAIGWWQEFAGGRTPAALAIADQCVDWIHKPREVRALDPKAVIDRCNTYFQVRSERDGDEDDERWTRRHKCGTAGPPPCG